MSFRGDSGPLSKCCGLTLLIHLRVYSLKHWSLPWKHMFHLSSSKVLCVYPSQIYYYGCWWCTQTTLNDHQRRDSCGRSPLCPRLRGADAKAAWYTKSTATYCGILSKPFSEFNIWSDISGLYESNTRHYLTYWCCFAYFFQLNKLILGGHMQVHEGRNHEVRELVKNAGLEVSFAFSLLIIDFYLFQVIISKPILNCFFAFTCSRFTH